MTQLFDKFDFKLLDDSSFKEDSVREEIIVPILTKLGYSATSNNKIIRSKNLEHPFTQFGTKSQKVNIIPDYLIQIDNEYKFVLDAKAPNEIITAGKNVEQVYSYAAHREIRTNLYGLCNGRELIVFDINETMPKFQINISEIDTKWNDVFKVISPLALTKPYIFTFKPDFGFHLRRLGFDNTTENTFLGLWTNLIAKVSDDIYSIGSYLPFEDQTYCASFDFDKSLLQKFLDVVPKEKQDKVKQALRNYPFKLKIETKEDSINIGIIAKLSEKMEFGKSEAFVPFIVTDFINKR